MNAKRNVRGLTVPGNLYTDFVGGTGPTILVITVHRTESTYLTPGAGLTLLSEHGTYDNLLVRAGSPGRYVHLTLVVQ